MKVKIQELRDLSKEEMILKISACKEELNKLNYSKVIGQIEKPHRFKILRKEIARLETLLKEASKTKGK